MLITLFQPHLFSSVSSENSVLREFMKVESFLYFFQSKGSSVEVVGTILTK